MGGGLGSRCVGPVCGADGAVRQPSFLSVQMFNSVHRVLMFVF